MARKECTAGSVPYSAPMNSPIMVIREEDLVLAGRIGTVLKDRGERVTTAESCTGGLVCATFTAVPGSSEWFEGGVVAYANRLKESLLGIDPALLREHGAVSGEVAEAMALGSISATGAEWSLSTTGIAGPSGGTPEKPVGTVHVGIAHRDAGSVLAHSRHFLFRGDRNSVRALTVASALAALSSALSGGPVHALPWESRP